MAPSLFAKHDKENFPFLVYAEFEQLRLQMLAENERSQRPTCLLLCLSGFPTQIVFTSFAQLPRNSLFSVEARPILLLKRLNCNLRTRSAVNGIQFFIYAHLTYCRFIARILPTYIHILRCVASK